MSCLRPEMTRFVPSESRNMSLLCPFWGQKMSRLSLSQTGHVPFSRLTGLASLRMLRKARKALNVHWSSHTTNEELYNKLPKVSNKVASRRLGLAGHCYRHPELSAQPLILWEPKHGHRGRGRPRASYIDTLKRDTGADNSVELASMMAERKVWRGRVVGRLRPTR